MPKLIDDPHQTAVVEPAVDLFVLAAEINAEHEAGEEATRKGLEHFRAAGEALIRAKAACGGRKFKPWLKEHVNFGRTTAYSYIKLAENWPICSTAEHMRDALRLLTEKSADGITGHEQPNRGKTNEWLTPRYILDALGKFDLDPCAALDQPWATAREQLTVRDDGLKKTWAGRVWLNPPYGEQTAVWLEKMAKHQDGVVLIYARTETRMFFDHVWGRANGIFFLKGRISFCTPDGSTAATEAGAPSVLVSYDPTSTSHNYHSLKCCKLPGQFLTIQPT
jgi:DNA N-6-adenine-methyltransferase (Dam)